MPCWRRRSRRRGSASICVGCSSQTASKLSADDRAATGKDKEKDKAKSKEKGSKPAAATPPAEKGRGAETDVAGYLHRSTVVWQENIRLWRSLPGRRREVAASVSNAAGQRRPAAPA